MTIATIIGKDLEKHLVGLDLQPLTPRDFVVELIASAPEFVLVTGDSAKTNDYWDVPNNPKEFQDLIDECQRRRINVVFWADHDPLDSEVFSNVLWMFDLVATTDTDVLERLEKSGISNSIMLPWFASDLGSPSRTNELVERLSIPRPLGRSFLPSEVFDTARHTIPSVPFTPAIRSHLGGLTIGADTDAESDRIVGHLKVDGKIERRKQEIRRLAQQQTRATWIQSIRAALAAGPEKRSSSPPITGRFYGASELFSGSDTPNLHVTTQRDGVMTFRVSSGGSARITSKLIGISMLKHSAPAKVVKLGAKVSLSVTYRDTSGSALLTIESDEIPPGSFAAPSNATSMEFTLDIDSKGILTLLGIDTRGTKVPNPPLDIPAENLVIAPSFPTYNNPYQNGYVFSRLRAYRERGFETSVALLRTTASMTTYREYEGFQIGTGPADSLRAGIDEAKPRRIIIHRLNEAHANLLKDYSGEVIVWIHGHEIQDSKHRSFLKTNDAKTAAAAKHSANATKLWRQVFTSTSDNWRFVFVSRYLAEQSFADLGIRLPDHRWTVIPNPIDTDLFEYHAKDPDDRFKVLSLRPYTSATQGNDLAVSAVVELSQRPGFERYSFTFAGDGPEWEKTLAPIVDLPNVNLRRGFIQQRDIPDLYRQFGVFLIPARMETQGVSRGEAMSSGLVPITNPVGAVPEFVDDSCAMLVESENPDALADAIETLADDPALFKRLSAAASLRIRNELASNRIVDADFKFFDGHHDQEN